MDSQRVKLVYENNLHYITKEDYKAASAYLSDPEEYNFRKILGW